MPPYAKSLISDDSGKKTVMESPDSKRLKVDKQVELEPEHEVVVEEGPVLPDLAVQGNLQFIQIWDKNRSCLYSRAPKSGSPKNRKC